MLINFVDSSFAIGESNSDTNLRYIKQIKARNTEIIYDTNNVLVCEIGKPINFLQFLFKDFGNERDHLKQYSNEDREATIQKAKELSKSGLSQRLIAKELGIAVGTVNKYINK